jgi:hypothetical protein
MCACAIWHGVQEIQVKAILYGTLHKRDGWARLRFAASHTRFRALRRFATPRRPIGRFLPIEPLPRAKSPRLFLCPQFEAARAPCAAGSLASPSRRRAGGAGLRAEEVRRSAARYDAEIRAPSGRCCAGLAQGGVSLLWRGSPAACGPALSTQVPGHAPAFAVAGFARASGTLRFGRLSFPSAFAAPPRTKAVNLAPSRSTAPSPRQVRQGTDCPPSGDGEGSVRRL